MNSIIKKRTKIIGFLKIIVSRKNITIALIKGVILCII